MENIRRSLTADRDAIDDMVRRRGLASTVRLISQVTAASNRYYQTTQPCKLDDTCYACAWDVAQTILDDVAGDISQALRRVG